MQVYPGNPVIKILPLNVRGVGSVPDPGAKSYMLCGQKIKT